MIDLITAIGKLSVIGESGKTSIGVRATSEYGYISHLVHNTLTEGYYLTLQDNIVVLKNLFNTNIVSIIDDLSSYRIEDLNGKYYSDAYADHQPSAFVLEDTLTLATILSGEHKKLKSMNPFFSYVIFDERTSNVYYIDENDGSFNVFNYETLKDDVIEFLPVHQILDDDLYRYKVIIYRNDQDWKKLNYHNLLVNGID